MKLSNITSRISQMLFHNLSMFLFLIFQTKFDPAGNTPPRPSGINKRHKHRDTRVGQKLYHIYIEFHRSWSSQINYLPCTCLHIEPKMHLLKFCYNRDNEMSKFLATQWAVKKISLVIRKRDLCQIWRINGPVLR